MNKYRKGFTLIELVIVMAIIGVLITLAISSVSRYIKIAKNTQINANASVVKNAVIIAITLDPNIEVEEYVWVDDPTDHVNWGYFAYNESHTVGNMPNGSWGFIAPEDIIEFLPDDFPIAHGGKGQKVGEYSAHIIVNNQYPSNSGTPDRYVNGSLISDDLPNGTVIRGGSMAIVIDYLADDGVLYTILNPKTPNTFWPFSEKNWLEDR